MIVVFLKIRTYLNFNAQFLFLSLHVLNGEAFKGGILIYCQKLVNQKRAIIQTPLLVNARFVAQFNSRKGYRVYKNTLGDLSKGALQWLFNKINRKQTKRPSGIKIEIFLKNCYQKIDKINPICVKKKWRQANRLIRIILTGENKMTLKCHLGGVLFIRGHSRCCCYSRLHMRFYVFVIEFEIYIEKLGSSIAL